MQSLKEWGVISDQPKLMVYFTYNKKYWWNRPERRIFELFGDRWYELGYIKEANPEHAALIHQIIYHECEPEFMKRYEDEQRFTTIRKD